MKKVICAVLLLTLFLVGCVSVPDSWKIIGYDGFGEISVPEEDWYFCKESNRLTVKDSDGKIIMQQIFAYEYTEKEFISGEVFSGGGYAYMAKVSMNGEDKELLLLLTGDTPSLAVVDDSIDYETLRKIAKSFHMAE